MMSMKNQQEVDTERFATLFSKFTGINKSKVTAYLKDNPVNMIFEHPATLEMNEKQYDKVKSIMELKSLYNNLKEEDRYTINSSEKAGKYFRDYFSELKDKEYVACSYLDTKLQIIKTEIIHEGTIDQSMLVPREVAKKALLHDAKSVMLSHNHPSGNPTPSSADVVVTERIKEALEVFDMKLMDHIVVGDRGRFVSLAEKGYLREEKEPYQMQEKQQTTSDEELDESENDMHEFRTKQLQYWQEMANRERN